MKKRILPLLFLVLLVLYSHKGILVTIGNLSKSNIKNITLSYDGGEKSINNYLKEYNEVNVRIRPNGETGIKLKYEIEDIGCFNVDINAYIEYEYTGKVDILIMGNGNIDYRYKIYLFFLDEWILTKAWSHATVTPQKILCR